MTRMTRRAFLMFTIALVVLYGLCFYVAQGGTFDPTDLNTSNYAVAAYVALVALTIVNIAMSVRRLHDMNSTGWWVMFSVVPLANLVLLLVLLFRRGTVGLNDYGRDPRKRAAQ